MEQTAKILIYIHAFFGGLGLITGLISISVKKGSELHKKSGKIFSWSMVISSALSLFIARMPQHENLFLFLIGVFTIYMVLAGNRSLTLRSKVKSHADNVDKVISGAMLVASIIMLIIGIYGMLQKVNNSVLYLFFGGFGVFMTLRDFQSFKNFSNDKTIYIRNHIGRMVGALIASITAFLVAGLNIGTVAIWMSPTILGLFYIVYSTKKFTSPKKSIEE